MVVAGDPAGELVASDGAAVFHFDSGADVLHVAILMYAWLASFAMIGGVLYVRRAELWLSSHRIHRNARRRKKSVSVSVSIDLLIDRIFAEWRGGAYGNAWRTIEKPLSSSPRPGDELQILFQRASQWPDQRLASSFGTRADPALAGCARRTAMR